MDENRSKSIVFFILMGLGFVLTILYVFVIAPNNNKRILGSNDLVLDIPIQKWNLRYTDSFVPFCMEDSSSIQFKVAENSSILSSSDGVVVSVKDSVVTIEVLSNIYIEYYPISNLNVFKDDFVTSGSTLGKVDGDVLNFRVKDIKNREYLCPYGYFNDFGSTVLDDYLSLLEYEDDVCECNSVGY